MLKILFLNENNIYMSNRDIIPHNDALNMLELSMLVYNYGKNFKFKKNEDIDSFITNIKNTDLGNMNETRKKALLALSHDCPHGNVVTFIDNSTVIYNVSSQKETKNAFPLFSEEANPYLIGIMTIHIQNLFGKTKGLCTLGVL